MVTQPSILNGPTVYETGAGIGGKIEFFSEQIKSNKYPCVKIKDVIFTCQNLYEDFTGISNSYSNSNPCGFYKTDNKLFGKYYNNLSISIIDNWLQNNSNGWRVATKTDYEKLLSFDGGNLKSPLSWNDINNNLYIKTGFSAIASGFYNVSEQFLSIGNDCYLLTSTQNDNKNYYAHIPSNNEIGMNITNTYGTLVNCWPIRLCKDA